MIMAEESLLNGDLSQEYPENSAFEDESALLEAERPLTVGDVQRVLHPLRETADRVGKQVEEFAENLDRLSSRIRPSAQKTVETVLPFIEAYKRISNDTVRRLRKAHNPQRQEDWKKRLRNSTARASRAPNQADDDERLASQSSAQDMTTWESEEQTWTLLSLMLQIQHPPSKTSKQNYDSATTIHRPANDSGTHQFSSEQAIWSAYLAENDIAWERHLVTGWLQQCADESGPDIESVVEELEQGADRGDGLSAHGWLYSKEKIKAQKRLRSGQVPDTMTTSDKSRPLITQLDPDAISRQSRSVEQQDRCFEQAIWRACWEMVRRGKDWAFIRDWCKERVEGWRAVIMLGDPRSSPGTNSLQTRSLWRKACSVASLHSEVDRYENAVYGALSGNLTSVLKVCKTWEDAVFSYYNCYLIRGFDEYISRALPRRVSPSLQQTFEIADTFPRSMSGTKIIEKTYKDLTSAGKSPQTIQMVQGSLIAQRFLDFVALHGSILLNSSLSGPNAKIFPDRKVKGFPQNIGTTMSLESYDILRMLTHMLFIFYDLGYTYPAIDNQIGAESIVVAYIDFLGKAGKLALLPSYASRLRRETAIYCLARQFPRIRDNQDRSDVLKLAGESGMDVNQLLVQQLQLVIGDNANSIGGASPFPALSIMSKMKEDRSQWRHIKFNFVTAAITDDQIDLIQGLRWYLLGGTWEGAMSVGAVTYKHFLRTGAFAAGRELCRVLPFAELSLAKTQSILGHSIDLNEFEYGSVGVLSDKRAQAIRMLEESKNFRDMEALFFCLDALQDWRQSVPIVVRSNRQVDQETMRGIKASTQHAYTTLKSNMEVLLDDWLSKPYDDDEARDFTRIRDACLPEVILAYITFLNQSAKYITRSHLLDCMELAPRISNNPELLECFVRTQRVGELVDVLALSGVTMIQAEESSSKTWKRSRDGRSSALWNVGAGKGQA